MADVIRVGTVGYGGRFNTRGRHLDPVSRIEGLTNVAVCDIDPARLQAASQDYPGIATHPDISDMIDSGCVDLAVIVTPHNTHADLAVACLEAGLHVVVEKPFCITDAGSQRILDAGRQNDRMVAVYHNRHWDGDYMALKQIVRNGLLGKVFRIERHTGRYGPGAPSETWWRSDRAISGGALYDMGAHTVEWFLDLVGEKVEHVTGSQLKNPDWDTYDNEDHSELTIRFEGGCLATYCISRLWMANRPGWTVVGDRGSATLIDGNWLVKSLQAGYQMETWVEFHNSDWGAFWENVAEHLLDGLPLAMPASVGARVTSVLHAANRSAANGGMPVVPVFPGLSVS